MAEMIDKFIEEVDRVILVQKTGIDRENITDSDSYFSAPARDLYTRLDQVPFEDNEKLREYLAAFWKDDEKLRSLIPAMVDLAYSLKKTDQQQQGDLSPYIYTLF